MHRTDYSFSVKLILVKLSDIHRPQMFSHRSRIPETCELKQLENTKRDGKSVTKTELETSMPLYEERVTIEIKIIVLLFCQS